MPKIEAATVAEHRALVQERLVEAAEQLLRSGDGQRLTAAAVSSAAGIARNSIYRYVDTVEDLRTLVVARYLPAWVGSVDAAMAEADGPAERIVVWVRANLEQAGRSGHGWLMEAVRVAPTRPDPTLVEAHSGMRGSVTAAWVELLDGDTERAAVAAAFAYGLLEEGFRQLDAGRDLDLVLQLGERAARSLVDGLR